MTPAARGCPIWCACRFSLRQQIIVQRGSAALPRSSNFADLFPLEVNWHRELSYAIRDQFDILGRRNTSDWQMRHDRCQANLADQYVGQLGLP